MAIKNYQFSDFRTEVKRRLNEATNDGLWTTPEINSFINHALLRVVMDTRVLQQDTPINVTANIAYYPLPPDVLIPMHMYTNSAMGALRLFPTFILSLDKMYGGMYQWEKDSSNLPQEFVPFSFDHFILWPAPSSNNTVTLHYVPQPSTLINDTDTTILPLVAQKLVPIQASWLAMLKLDQQKAQLFQKEYKQRLVSVRELTRHENQSRPSLMEPGRSFDRSHANPSVRAYRNSRRYF